MKNPISARENQNNDPYDSDAFGISRRDLAPKYAQKTKEKPLKTEEKQDFQRNELVTMKLNEQIINDMIRIAPDKTKKEALVELKSLFDKGQLGSKTNPKMMYMRPVDQGYAEVYYKDRSEALHKLYLKIDKLAPHEKGAQQAKDPYSGEVGQDIYEGLYGTEKERAAQKQSEEGSKAQTKGERVRDFLSVNPLKMWDQFNKEGLDSFRTEEEKAYAIVLKDLMLGNELDEVGVNFAIQNIMPGFNKNAPGAGIKAVLEHPTFTKTEPGAAYIKNYLRNVEPKQVYPIVNQYPEVLNALIRDEDGMNFAMQNVFLSMSRSKPELLANLVKAKPEILQHYENKLKKDIGTKNHPIYDFFMSFKAQNNGKLNDRELLHMVKNMNDQRTYFNDLSQAQPYATALRRVFKRIPSNEKEKLTEQALRLEEGIGQSQYGKNKAVKDLVREALDREGIPPEALTEIETANQYKEQLKRVYENLIVAGKSIPPALQQVINQLFPSN